MHLRSGDAEQTVRAFYDTYLARRDAPCAAAFFTEKAQWIGMRREECLLGRTEALRFLQDRVARDPRHYQVAYGEIHETLTSDGSALLFSLLHVSRGSSVLDVRITAYCVWEEGCKIASLHASPLSTGQSEKQYFPSASPGGLSPEFERRIRYNSADILGRNIPGGIMGSYLEPGAPLYYINDRILDYLGYSYEAFMSATGGSANGCIHPADRSHVMHAIEKALSQNLEYEIQYRMRKKDDSYIWVNDIGKKGVSEDGRLVCLSVLRDITSEVSAKSALINESRENEFQAKRYDQLFQSVLCGIVQYCIDHGGKVRFKNANREAIRMFGYTSETFWAKDDWDLALLIATIDRARIIEEIGRLRAPGDKQSFEYRLLQKNENEIWIVGSAEIIQDMDGEAVFQSVFIDVDSQKRAEWRNRQLSDQVEASNELLKLALEHTSTCEFYYYPQTHSCSVPPRTCAYYGFQAQYQNLPASFAEEAVAPESLSPFFQMYDQINRGARTACEEVHLKNGVWCRETLSTIRYADDGQPTFVIGILEDISKQKEMEAALLATRSRDSLTGLYNKETGIKLAQAHLACKHPDESCGLMLLDMDNFEQINREEGRVFADVILQEVADILRAETGPDDYQIRLGGDEFMLFIKNCDKARATLIGPHIAELVSDLFIQLGKDLRISVSIGMCVTQVVEEYHALYRCAESTLKYVKENDKGHAACYLDTSNELGVFLTQLYTDEHQVNEIDRRSAQREEDLVSFALELLGKSKNLNDAVFLLLARIGKYYNFDRVSIIDSNADFLSFLFTYQWAKSRARLQVGQVTYVTEETYAQASNMYDDEGLCDYNINDEISEISSCLHAGIWNYGEYVGSMSFEIDVDHYPWTQEQRKLLKELVKIVPSFLMKAKSDAVSQAKTDFLSRMSHEIRTPMNAISGMTTIAKTTLGDRAKTLDCLNKIESANAYLLGLINDVLDMSRIESGKLELNPGPVDLARQMVGLEALLKPQAVTGKLDLRLLNAYLENRPILADGLRLNQVLVNIMGNAIKFTDSGGSVEIKIAPVAADDGGVTLRFSVRDTGVGIEKYAIDRIFNAFEQADRNTASQYGGTGLGLSISSHLVQMMGGQLEVKSEVGVGSEFFFTLLFPYASEAAKPKSECVAETFFDFAGARILLAEDNDLNLEIAQAILEMNGFVVESAQNGLEALRRFAAADPYRYDAILMDISMPMMDGLESTRRIRTLGRVDSRTIPIIALTANAFDEDSKKSLESGMNGHLSKPLEVDKMLRLLAECMQKTNI